MKTSTRLYSRLEELQTRESLALNQLPSTDAAATGNVVAFNQSFGKIGLRL